MTIVVRLCVSVALAILSAAACAQDKPNIPVIWGDDVGQFLSTSKEFPPRQEPASFSTDQVMEKLQIGSGSK